MYTPKLSALLVAALLAATAPLHAQTAPAASGAGAGAATGAAAGAISAGVVIGTVAGLAVISALTSGSSGPVENIAVATKSTAAAATAATTASTQVVAAAAAVNTSVSTLQNLVTTNGLTAVVGTALQESLDAQAAANTANTAAQQAAANLANAPTQNIVGVACVAVSSCTRAEVLRLTYLAASTAKAAADANIVAYNKTFALAVLLKANGVTDLETVRVELDKAKTAIAAAQTAANTAVSNYQAVIVNLNTTGTVLTFSTGTTGTTGTF